MALQAQAGALVVGGRLGGGELEPQADVGRGAVLSLGLQDRHALQVRYYQSHLKKENITYRLLPPHEFCLTKFYSPGPEIRLAEPPLVSVVPQSWRQRQYRKVKLRFVSQCLAAFADFQQGVIFNTLSDTLLTLQKFVKNWKIDFKD